MEFSSTPLRRPQKSTTQRLSESQLLGGMPHSSPDTERDSGSKEQGRLEEGIRGGYGPNTGRSTVEAEEGEGGKGESMHYYCYYYIRSSSRLVASIY